MTVGTEDRRQVSLALAVSGGLGDHVVIARFVRDLVAEAGNVAFDVFTPNPTVAALAFGQIRGYRAALHDILFDHVVADYDIGMRLHQAAVIYREHVRWQAVRDNPPLARMVDRLLAFRPNIETFLARHPFMDNFLAQTAVFNNASRRDYLHAMAGLAYGGDELKLPGDTAVAARLALRPGEYVTVHNGFDTGFVISGRRATKCYPHFRAVVTQLQQAFPHLRFVQIGSATSEPIAACDHVLLDKTSLPEAIGLIAGAILHLDNEGGLVHVAAAVGTRSTVVFGPTPSDYFGYPRNVNIDPPVCGNCWWMTRTWMDGCAKGYEQPRCMSEQPPEIVANRAQMAIAEAMFAERDTGSTRAAMA